MLMTPRLLQCKTTSSFCNFLLDFATLSELVTIPISGKYCIALLCKTPGDPNLFDINPCVADLGKYSLLFQLTPGDCVKAECL